MYPAFGQFYAVSILTACLREIISLWLCPVRTSQECALKLSLRVLFLSPILSNMKSAVHVARMGETGKVRTIFWWGNLRETESLEDLDVDGSIMLE